MVLEGLVTVTRQAKETKAVNGKEKQNAVTRDSIPMYIATLCNPQKIF